MTGAISCMFCRAPEDLSGMKLVNHCDLSDGEPCPACRDYIEIEAQISAAQQILNDLIIQRSKIRSRVNQKHDFLTRQLPTEIVGSVFQFCFPSDSLDVFEKDDRCRTTSREKDKWIVFGPLLLTSICRMWRNIAWGLEPLWTVLRLCLDRGNNPNYIVLAKEWLERASLLPLSIRISNPRRNITAQNVGALQLIAMINERSKQWKNLDIFSSSWSISQFNGDSGGAPYLQALRIGHKPGSYSDDEASFSLQVTKPRPSRLIINGYQLSLIHIEWKHLTSVFLSQPSLNETIELLRLAPGIIDYKIYAIQKDTEQFPKPNQPIIYGALESLDLDCAQNPKYRSQAQEIITFFESFIFPNLKHLKIKSGGKKNFKGNRLSWAAVITHIASSSPPLISLAIQHLGPLPFTECIIPILQLNPLLRDLDIWTPIHWSKWDEKEKEEHLKLFQLLAGNPLRSNDTETLFLPNLESMNLLVGHAFEEEANHFWTHIPGIFGPISDIHTSHRRPLKTLRVRLMWYGYKIKSKDIALQLLTLRQKGIVLDLKDKYERDMFQQIIGP